MRSEDNIEDTKNDADYTQNWIEHALECMNRKLKKGMVQAVVVGEVPYSTAGKEWRFQPIHSWVSGFWPALMWQMYLETKDTAYRQEALRVECMMDEALKDFEILSHDVGFMWLPVSGVHYALEGNAESLRRVKYAADMLAARFNPHGFLRAWNDREEEHENRSGWAIIDCMMNLPLLYTMSELMKDPRFALIATAHATTAAHDFVRADGSCRHIVCYDAGTGEFLTAPAGQGYAEESCWTRGAAWAIYGFSLCFMYTQNTLFLETAKKVADYFLAHLPDDLIPPIDFKQPEEPDWRDESACAIAADGLLELAGILSKSDIRLAGYYKEKAVAMLQVLYQRADWTEECFAALKHCASKYHKGEHDISMNYADYFFVEGLRRLKGEGRSFWKPLDFAGDRT